MVELPIFSKKCVFFDFDGVIADSVDAKILAFGELYRAFGEDVAAQVMDYQREHPGETRFEKIPRFHRELLGVELAEEEIKIWCDRLSDIVLDQVVASALLPDVLTLLTELRLRGITAHVVSGTPHDELQVIVARKGLGGFFKSLQGSPRKKAEIVREIMAADGLAAEDCLFIGDAMTDYDCAIACDIDFVGVLTNGSHPFPEGSHVCARLGELLQAPRGAKRLAA